MKQTVWALILALSFFAGQTTRSAELPFVNHTLELRERVLHPEEGLLLGNGDLSVSVYQDADRIIWRFGKGDVWDRRLDLSDDPKPAHIDEIAHGIKVEGWKCPPYGGGPVEAMRGTKNPKRMKELCQGAPPSYQKRPYPCPKPVGELALHLPAGPAGLEDPPAAAHRGSPAARITCTWASGVRLEVECFVPPAPNVLVVRWKVENWNERTAPGTTAARVVLALPLGRSASLAGLRSVLAASTSTTDSTRPAIRR